MALIEIQHVVADMYSVDPDWTDAIVEGMLVKLNTSGLIEACDTAGELVLGIAGDTQADTAPAGGTGTSNTPYADQLVINANGGTRWTQNRVSDFYDETLASGKITVYQSGGKFATDIYESTVDTALPSNPLYTSANGKLTTTPGAGNIVGICTTAAAAWDSGVPGIDTAKGSITLGDYVEFKLTV